MNLYSSLLKLREEGKPARVGLIGAGKFATMYLAQVRKTPGVHLVGVADLFPEKARASLKRTLWTDEQISAVSLEDAVKTGKTHVLDSSDSLISSPFVDIIIEATGNPYLGVEHALKCMAYKKDLVMVNVEADAIAGPLLSKKAAEAGIVYSMAYGDQPAMICEMVDWARTVGFEVVAAGKGTKYLPIYHQSTPDTIWNYYGITPEDAQKGGMNPKMFNSFLDGTKSAIEMTVVSNATGLKVNPAGLQFPPCGGDDLHHILKPVSAGGLLPESGMAEVVSSLERDGRPVYRDIRFGIYVVVKGDSEYMANCFREYGIRADSTGDYISLIRPYHMIGLELGVSVASIAVRREPTGVCRSFNSDVVATAKKDLKAGEILDGEGGFTIYGKAMPAKDSLSIGGVPLGLCNDVKLKRPVAAGASVCWDDIEFDASSKAYKLRMEMEELFK